MKETVCRRNIFLYKWYVIFNEPLFWGPILVITLQELGHLSLSDIFYMEAVATGICIVLDMPAGALADIIGRKRAVVAARILYFTSALYFAFMTTIADAWIGNVFWALGMSLQNGADSALLYDTLKECDREDDYKRITGQALGMRFAMMAGAALVTGWLASISLRLPLYACLPFLALSLGASLFLTEPKRSHGNDEKKKGHQVMRGAIRHVITSPALMWMIAYAALLLTISKIWFFTYNPYFELVKLPLAMYGVIFFLLNVTAWLTSHYAHLIEKKLGEEWCVIMQVLCMALPILLMGAFPMMAFAYLVLIQNIVRGFLRPFMEDYIHRRVNSNIRATAQSVQSTVSNITGMVCLAIFGVCVKLLSLQYALVVLGIAALVLGSLSYAWYRARIRHLPEVPNGNH